MNNKQNSTLYVSFGYNYPTLRKCLTVITCKTSFIPSSFSLQHPLNWFQGTWAEVSIIHFISWRSSCEHDIITILASRNTSLVVLRIMLQWDGKFKIKCLEFIRSYIFLSELTYHLFLKALTGDPKLWPISWAIVTWDTAGGTCFP